MAASPERELPPAHNPVPNKLAPILREARWLVVLTGAALLVLVLASYNPADPGWSHASANEHIHNAGGIAGAWLADLLLYLFGVSAYAWVGFALYWVFRGYHRLDRSGTIERRPVWLACLGFAIALVAASALEAQRLYGHAAALPLAPGGVVGIELGDRLLAWFGFTGGTLALLLAAAIGLSLFTGLSWLALAENIGAAVETLWGALHRRLQTRRDTLAGRQAVEARDEAVEEERRREEEHEPVFIEIPPPPPPASARVERERQQPLFADLPDSPLPPLHLLDEAQAPAETLAADTLEFTSRLIERKLRDFGVEVQVTAALPGPVITRYEIEPAVGVKGSQIVNLVKDLARALSVVSIRVVETIPGKSCMGLELPNPKRQVVRLHEILSAQSYADTTSRLTLALGKDIAGRVVVADLAKMPHLLVAGTTGSGKSVAVNAMILSLLYKAEPAQVRLILVDPKMLELSVYEGIPHLLAPVVTDMKHAANALNWCVAEMERRYRLMSKLGVRNIAGFNARIAEARKRGESIQDPFALPDTGTPPLASLPFIVVVIDELADLMMVVGKKVEEQIARLAQKARAAGVHLILATQRPSVDVITGLIKANIPTRVAFQVSSRIDSRTILDQMGAEALLGQGDMLYLAPGTGLPQRVHGAFVADDEVHRVVEHMKSLGAPEYIEGILAAAEEESSDNDAAPDGEADPLYDQAVEIVLRNRRASISLVQRHLRIGYNRAARLLEQMERSGLVSAMQSNGNRDILVPAGVAS